MAATLTNLEVTTIERAVEVVNGATLTVEVITMAHLGSKTVTLVKAQITEMKEITKFITINSTLTEEWTMIADSEDTVTKIIIIIDLSLEANVVGEGSLMDGPHAATKEKSALNNATHLEKMSRGDEFS